MLSSVYLTGRLGEVLADDLRYVELDDLVPGPDSRFDVHRIPVRNPRGVNSEFMRAKAGLYVVVKGRLSTDERIGLLVVSELEEVLGPLAITPMQMPPLSEEENDYEEDR